ncbi:gliding motility-associated C-terminal domain-containing protein [Myroides sp. DF42-4-2]|uniref:gliding motility-associated C-terminal domain-containing protein n=1 Tax=unclassified Myroides TaxID=2642485 RepID=UPI002578B02E|nr:gliding motility-associated C-terminal domain-containing protein [Myroides sp. DF42-4-2]MDM1408032.1 gliding motility-associated C-terminal domain-containing protein [Myroides sp. DF42-4-2]
MKYFYLLILALCSNLIHSQRINPEDVILVCSNQQIVGQTPQNTAYNNLYTSCSDIFSPLTSSLALFFVEIESGSTFTFTISPQGPVDYDFASWQNPDFNNLGLSDRGSQNDGVNTALYDIGLSLTETMLCEGPGVRPGTGAATVPGFVRYYDVQPGDGILIAINRWSPEDAGFTLSFGGDAVLNCDILGKTYEKCDINHDKKEVFDLQPIKEEINNINNTFIIDFFESIDDARNVNATNILPSPYTVSVEDYIKKIYARFKRSNGLFVKTIEITLIANETPKVPDEALKDALCYQEVIAGKNVATFDLTKFETQLSEGHINPITFSYWEQVNGLPQQIANPTAFKTSGQPITIHMEINGKCPVETTLTLTVNDLGIEPTSFVYSEFCGIETETGIMYNLEQTIPILLQNKDKDPFKLQFFTSLQDAENENNEIVDPARYLLPYDQVQTLTVRISDDNSCFTYSEITLNAKPRFRIADQVNTDCTPFLLPSLPEGYTYYLKANAEGESLDQMAAPHLFYGPKTIYIHAKKEYDQPTLNVCTFEDSFTITTEGCIIPKGISPNGDGKNDYWDLTPYGVLNLKIFNRYGVEVYKKTGGYKNEWYGQSNGNTKLPSGTYWYYFEGLTGVYTGWIELIY